MVALLAKFQRPRENVLEKFRRFADGGASDGWQIVSETPASDLDFSKLPDAPWLQKKSLGEKADAEVGIRRTRPGSPSNSDDLDFSKLPDAPWTVASETPQYGALQSAYEGAKAGLTANFSDELGGASAASGLPRNLPSYAGNLANLAYKAVKPTIGAARLAYEHLTGQPGPATEEYNKAVDEIRARQEAMKAQHPYAYGAGEIGGGLASIAIAPEARAASLGSRALQAGKVGAAYGALSGAGEGTNPDERAENALIGAVTGGAGAAGAVPVSALAEKVISGATKPVVGAVRGWLNPETETARRVGTALERDYKNVAAGQAQGLTPTEYLSAQAEGQPVIIGDLGGATTKALMRSTANVSPEGRDILESSLNERFRNQSERAGNTIRNLVTGGADAAKTRAQLEAEYNLERGAAYRAAYDAGNRPLQSDQLSQIARSPAVAAAMKDALARGQDRAVADRPNLQSRCQQS